VNHEVSSLIPIDFILAVTDLFAGLTLTLHKSQVHCFGVKQWWTCSSLTSAPLPADAGCETFEWIVSTVGIYCI